MNQRIRQWWQRPRKPQDGWVTLDHRHLYIVPTWLGMWFAVLLLTMLLASLNFNLNLGLLLTFTLISIALASMWFAYRNLLGLKVGVASQAAVFASGQAVLHHAILNDSETYRVGIATKYLHHLGEDIDVSPSAESVASVPLGQLARGIYPIGRIKVWSEFPFRLFHVWSYADLGQTIIVYPAPETSAPSLPAPDRGEDGISVSRQAADELPELIRPYQQGDTLKQIAWKHSARMDDLVSRYGETDTPSQLWLSWQQTPSQLPNEARLSRLCAWLLAAEANGLAYGLSIPGSEIPPNRGDAHLHACLSSLANWKG